MQPSDAVFDDEEVRRMARRQVSQMTGVAGAAVALTLFVMALSMTGRVAAPVTVTGIVGLWIVVALWTGRRHHRLRRRVWCMRLSDRGVEGYDYARHKISLDWSDVHQVDLSDEGLTIHGPSPCMLEVPYLFDDFATLSHLVVHQAECHDVRLSIEGTPVEQLDVYHLFPSLSSSQFGSRPGSAV